MIIPDSIIIILLIISLVFVLIAIAYDHFTYYDVQNDAIVYFLSGMVLVSGVCFFICCCVKVWTAPEENPTTSTSISTPEQATEDADTVVIDGQTYVLQNDDDGTAMQEGTSASDVIGAFIVLLAISIIICLIFWVRCLFGKDDEDDEDDEIAKFLGFVLILLIVTMNFCVQARNFVSENDEKAGEYSNTTVATSETAAQEEAADTVVIDGQTYVLQNDDSSDSDLVLGFLLGRMFF